jgi:Holliday junction resolvase RusA-like endonuclease
MSNIVKFKVMGQPVSWDRAGLAATGEFFTKPRQKRYMAKIRKVARQAMDRRPLCRRPMEMLVIASYRIPTSWTAKQHADPMNVYMFDTPDIDNMVKIFMDALTGIVYSDDQLIVAQHNCQCRGPGRPYVEVEINLMGEHKWPFIKPPQPEML